MRTMIVSFNNLASKPMNRECLTIMKRFLVSLLLLLVMTPAAWAARAPVNTLAQDPYASALLITLAVLTINVLARTVFRQSAVR